MAVACGAFRGTSGIVFPHLAISLLSTDGGIVCDELEAFELNRISRTCDRLCPVQQHANEANAVILDRLGMVSLATHIRVPESRSVKPKTGVLNRMRFVTGIRDAKLSAAWDFSRGLLAGPVCPRELGTWLRGRLRRQRRVIRTNSRFPAHWRIGVEVFRRAQFVAGVLRGRSYGKGFANKVNGGFGEQGFWLAIEYAPASNGCQVAFLVFTPDLRTAIVPAGEPGK